jgi:uncharacterized protein (DUF302 family)/uncharacterized membrane protein YidH (DUF202 family)
VKAETMDSPAKAALTDYLAAERTLLAWIRTGLALMGFGFVVARFGFFLQELRIAQRIPAAPSYGLSTWFGTALVALGVIVNVAAGWNHARLLGRLDRGEVARVRSSKLVVAFAFLLALLGLGMAIYLISIRTSTNSSSSNQRSASVQEESMALIDDNGIVNKASNHSVEETVEKIKGLLQGKGVTLFALVDHSGEAAKAGMNMRPTKLLIFGSPKAGTPVMLAAPSTAIDLPLKILVWEDGQGKVWISYNSPQYLQRRHGFPKDLLPNLAAVEAIAAKAAE